jgi:hypothetical protein
MRTNKRLWFMAALALAGACGGGSAAPRDGAGTGGGSGTDGGGTGGGGTGASGGLADAGDAAADGLSMCGFQPGPGSGDGCNTVEALGPCLYQDEMAGDPPPAAGGTLMEGSYDLVKDAIYFGARDGGFASPDPRRETVVFGPGNSLLSFSYVSVSGERVNREQGTVVVTGNMLMLTLSCPASDGAVVELAYAFTATATTLDIYRTGANGTAVGHYVKR